MNNSSDDFTWNTSTATSTTDTFTFNIGYTNEFSLITNGTVYSSSPPVIIPNHNWMPYSYVEYEPKWHKKYARYKLQIEKMWQ